MVQQVRLSYHKKPFRYAGKPFALRGRIKCADERCGCTITAETHRGHNYYSCTNYKGIHQKRIYIREEDLLSPIYEDLKKIKLTDKQVDDVVKGLHRTNEAKDRFCESMIAGLRAEYDKYEKRKSKLLDRRIDEEITRESYNKKLKEYEAKQENIATEMRKYQKADKEYYITVDMVLSLMQRAYEIVESSEPAEKRRFFNFLLQNCQLRGKKLNFELKSPFDGALKSNECSDLLP